MQTDLANYIKLYDDKIKEIDIVEKERDELQRRDIQTQKNLDEYRKKLLMIYEKNNEFLNDKNKKDILSDLSFPLIIKNLESQQNLLKIQIKEQNSLLKQINENVKNMNENRLKLEDTISTQRSKINDLNMNVKHYQSQYDTLHKRLSENNQKYSKLQNDKISLENQLSIQTIRIKESSDAIKNYKDKISSLETSKKILSY